MRAHFEELDRQSTPIGEITLRRRVEPTLRVDVYEVKLDDEFLMSSLFTVAEIALAHLAHTVLVDAFPNTGLDIAVGGLGLGYTAGAALEAPEVRSLHVVEALSAVIGWHRRHLLPLTPQLTADPRCAFVQGDFFKLVAAGSFGADTPARFHAVLLDIDHSPTFHLHPSHAAFYTPDGLAHLAQLLHPGGVFAMWSDGAPNPDFVAIAETVFASCAAHVVTFANFYTDGESSSTVYVAKTLVG